ncbi:MULTISPECIES: LysM peptidoglycan-binding domain-containing protein [unclassified Pseudoalteromonas]|uniref:LysM peptidoglycan-binding domain-containing protein n=1 Tax=unclassified Pseudoalteromonas TaxID=194690 RepID=UPI001109CAA7|nr:MULTISPECIES: LysM peptidoglycan-binding domain-containing protein [unclassified Pseudoalteromonas]TMN81724.1 lytic transglycosylase [Pseudoalteromonas sp. S410]TMN91886.1 lytic transglycosylase [Pseudoalteromonas sp. S408]TMN96174.1 lytic transglycosylase [Pseudoalteromonas sp. S409]TMN98458.1 lytic transglycosylase [Pseudoalteromonas sp. S407]TMO09664.1 lytic transglycosylase [Pseudoalteromonas sp. S186]
MRSLILCFLGLFLFGCESTEQKQTEAPQIFTHFEPDYANHENVTATVNPEQQTSLIEKNTPSLKLKNRVVKKRPAKTTDLWVHIANNLHFTVYQNRALKKRINWYLKQPKYLTTVSKRAAPYLYHIVKKIEQRNLPMEIALLPFVESDFRPTVASSQQAVGVWQLVGATAYHFGIKSDQWYDGRQDVLASTDAALDYLSYLHKRFNGNWLHALAAYNSGEGRVKRAIEKNTKRGKSTDFRSLSLPKETADYVPKLLALSYLVKHPQKGMKQPKLAYKPLTTQMNIGQQFDFSVIAKLSGIGSKQLHAINQGYLKNQSSPNGPHTLLLPIGQEALLKSQFFKSNFAGEYRVKQNDTLYAIAKRFSMSVKMLKQLNNKTNNFIGVGEKLLVGQPKTLPSSLTIDYKISPYLEHQEDIAIPTIEIDYTVKTGDSLWSISQLYDVPHSDLAKWNKLSASSILKPGRQLVLYIPQAEKPQAQPIKQDLLHDLQKTLNQPR